MKTYFLTFFALYVLLMLFLTFKFFKKESASNEKFLFANSNIGIALTFLGILATLFSTFTLQGMPNFFAKNGMGSWIFLGITDVALGGLMLYFGLKFRALASKFSSNPKNITELFKSANYPKIVIFLYLIFTTIFLIPYITIQIKGAAFLLQSVYPVGESYLFYSIFVVVLMLLYSSFGGIKAIFLTDAFQGVIILITIWIIAYFSLKSVGGMEELFFQVRELKPALLSVPGPNGVFGVQFLLISFISIVLMPYTQPQLSTRMLIAKDDKSFLKATLVFTFFVILVILPTMFIGFRGALVEEKNFMLYILQNDVPAMFYALFVIGVISASMSTTDSQLLAIGTEWGSFISKGAIKQNQNAKIYVKLFAFLTALISLYLAQSPFKSLVLFAINSFLGTSFLLPIVFSLHIKKSLMRNLLFASSFICVGVFMMVLFGILQKYVFGLRVELILYIFMALTMLFAHKKNQ